MRAPVATGVSRAGIGAMSEDGEWRAALGLAINMDVILLATATAGMFN